MIFLLSVVLMGGMTSGLAAYLQAEAKGWRTMLVFYLVLMVGLALMAWAAFGIDNGDARALAKLKGDPRVLAGGVLSVVMALAFVGAVTGKVFERRIDPVKLGLRTTVGVSFLQFGLIALRIFI